MTQQNAALCEQSAAATVSLSDQAEKLVAGVHAFRLVRVNRWRNQPLKWRRLRLRWPELLALQAQVLGKLVLRQVLIAQAVSSGNRESRFLHSGTSTMGT